MTSLECCLIMASRAQGVVETDLGLTAYSTYGQTVDQIERFYARNLPLSREMAINLQSFGDGDVG